MIEVHESSDRRAALVPGMVVAAGADVGALSDLSPPTPAGPALQPQSYSRGRALKVYAQAKSCLVQNGDKEAHFDLDAPLRRGDPITVVRSSCCEPREDPESSGRVTIVCLELWLHPEVPEEKAVECLTELLRPVAEALRSAEASARGADTGRARRKSLHPSAADLEKGFPEAHTRRQLLDHLGRGREIVGELVLLPSAAPSISAMVCAGYRALVVSPRPDGDETGAAIAIHLQEERLWRSNLLPLLVEQLDKLSESLRPAVKAASPKLERSEPAQTAVQLKCPPPVIQLAPKVRSYSTQAESMRGMRSPAAARLSSAVPDGRAQTISAERYEEVLAECRRNKWVR